MDYLLAELKVKAYGENRESSLREASDLFESFLTRLDHYGLLGPSDRQLYERFLEQRGSFRIISSNNPEEKRKIKINRFQEEKSLKQKLEVIVQTCLSVHERILMVPVSEKRVTKIEC